MKSKILVTGSSGLIGSEVSFYFDKLGYKVYGIDNNQREVFFGPNGSTRWKQKWLKDTLMDFTHLEADIRDREAIQRIIKNISPDVIIHAAAQPSHDKAALIPFADFDTNAVGTLNVLEGLRRVSNNIPFIFLSTNKVYGDAPNRIKLKEMETRWDYDDPEFQNGISEKFSVDQSKHSLFGASKLAADILVQEYGRYFNLPTTCLRGGCLTGPNHSGVELHGFLSYLIKCNLKGTKYTIFGYKGKQVRDNLHSVDVASFIEEFIKNPRFGEVYNIGGGKNNSCSILEGIAIIESITGREMEYDYNELNREGDHICYYSDLRKIKSHYPDWDISKNLRDTINEIADTWKCRL